MVFLKASTLAVDPGVQKSKLQSTIRDLTKIITSLLAFKKLPQFIDSFFRYSSMTLEVIFIFEHSHSKIIEVTFSFPEFATT